MTKPAAACGLNRPLTLSLDSRYLDVLESMAHMEGREVSDLAREYLEFYLKDYLNTELEAIGDSSLHGKILLQAWIDELEGKE